MELNNNFNNRKPYDNFYYNYYIFNKNEPLKITKNNFFTKSAENFSNKSSNLKSKKMNFLSPKEEKNKTFKFNNNGNLSISKLNVFIIS